MAHGSWLMAHCSWLMAHGSWLMAHGSWLMAHGSWLMVHGSWLMAHGSWLMAHGSRTQRHLENIQQKTYECMNRQIVPNHQINSIPIELLMHTSFAKGPAMPSPLPAVALAIISSRRSCNK